MKLIACFVIGMGHLVGEEIHSNEKRILIKNPGLYTGTALIDPIPVFYKNKNDLEEKFNIPIDKVLYFGEPDTVMVDAYGALLHAKKAKKANIQLLH